MPRYGIIDLGSNTIRLCVYEISSNKKHPTSRKDIHTLLNYKIMAGLASFVENGAITKKGIKKAISTINAHLKRASHFDCEEIKIFATAVIRNCSNSQEATNAIAHACNAQVSILSTQDEAHLGFIGAQLDNHLDSGVLVDIGGGSTELTLICEEKDQASVSIPQGSLSSYTSHVRGITPTQAEINAIRLSFIDTLRENNFGLPRHAKLFGIGGSIRSAAKVYGDVCNEGQRLDYILPKHLDTILEEYKTSPDEFLHEALQTIPDRIHTFIPGCIIIREIFAITCAEQLIICKSGIREGYLVDRILSR